MGDSPTTRAGFSALVLALGLYGCSTTGTVPSPAPETARDEVPVVESQPAGNEAAVPAAPIDQAIVDVSSPESGSLSGGFEDEDERLVAPALLGQLAIEYPDRVSAIDRRPPSSIRTSSVRVVLQVLVNTDGRPQHISIRSSDRPGSPFEESAIESVRGARFTPGTRDGEPTPAWALVRIAFPTP